MQLQRQSSTGVSLVVMAPDFSVSAGAPVTVFCHSRSVSDIDDHDQTSGRIKPDDGGAHLQCILRAQVPRPLVRWERSRLRTTLSTSVVIRVTTRRCFRPRCAPAMENGSGKLFANRPANPRDVAGGAAMEDAEPEKSLVSFCLTCLLLGACLMEAACSSAGSRIQ